MDQLNFSPSIVCCPSLVRVIQSFYSKVTKASLFWNKTVRNIHTSNENPSERSPPPSVSPPDSNNRYISSPFLPSKREPELPIGSYKSPHIPPSRVPYRKNENVNQKNLKKKEKSSSLSLKRVYLQLFPQGKKKERVKLTHLDCPQTSLS